MNNKEVEVVARKRGEGLRPQDVRILSKPSTEALLFVDGELERPWTADELRWGRFVELHGELMMELKALEAFYAERGWNIGCDKMQTPGGEGYLRLRFCLPEED